mgnify:FL=1
MKKIIIISIISNLLFFSCLSTSKNSDELVLNEAPVSKSISPTQQNNFSQIEQTDNKNQITAQFDDTMQDKTTNEPNILEKQNTQDLSKNKISKNSTNEQIEQQENTSPIQEKILESIEIDPIKPIIIEEKISNEEIKSDIDKLNKNDIETTKVELEEQQLSQTVQLIEDKVTIPDTKNIDSPNQPQTNLDENEKQPQANDNDNHEAKLNENEKQITKSNIDEQKNPLNESKNKNSSTITKQPESKQLSTQIKSETNKTQTAKQPEQFSKPEIIQEEKQTSFDLQEDASKASEQINEQQKKEEIIIPSRNIKIKNNQFVEINYPGTGWIYLGETERQNNLLFFGRKIQNDNTTFTLKSKKSGTAILHFYKNDSLSGKYIDDYIEVQIENESATDNTPVVSPEYAKIIPPKPIKTVQKTDEELQKNISPNEEDKKTQNYSAPEPVEKKPLPKEDFDIQTIIKNADNSENYQQKNSLNTNSSNTEQNIKDLNSIQNESTSLSQPQITYNSLDELFDKAQKAFDEKKYEEALLLVRLFLEESSSRIDEALFLEAQILETKSSVQNIKEAINDYDIIISDWPQSDFWSKAKKRSTYLKRFYIDIR